MAEFDIVISNGMVFDGRRSPRFKADIGIKDGVITSIGSLSGADAGRVIDATGLNVAPGFMDLHTHYDSQLFWDPYCSTSGWHGVTSVVVGNCGFGFAPVKADERERAMLTMTRNEAVPLATMKAGLPWDWETFPEFLESLERTPKSVNILALVPLNPLMVYVMGLERAKSGVLPTDAEHAEMGRLLDEAMEAGACGLSAQRMGNRSVQRDYDGSPMATDIMHDETMLALAEVLAKRNDGVIQYTYVDFAAVLSGDAAAMSRVRPHIEEVARVSGRPVIVGGAGEADTAWILSCHAKGLRVFGMGNTVTIMSQPMITNLAEAPNLFDFSLAWCQATVGTIDEVMAKLADPEVRAQMRAELPLLEGALGPIGEWVLLRAATPDIAKWDELPLAEVAPALGYDDLFDAFCEINLKERLATKWFFLLGGKDGPLGNSVELHKQLAQDPYMIPGISDGGAHTKYSTTGHYPTRYLMTYVREHGWHSLEEAHWRLSALPAFAAGFKDRGTLVEGAPADIVIYDLEALDITDRETAYDYPGNEWRVIDRPVGYHYILVNGQVTMDHDVQTDVPSGRLLRNGRARALTLA